MWFANDRLAKECADLRRLTRRLGPVVAKKVILRLEQMAAADSLDDMRRMPGTRAHELGGDRSGQVALDLGGPMRMIVEPAGTRPHERPDGGLDWTAIESIRVTEITDYH